MWTFNFMTYHLAEPQWHHKTCQAHYVRSGDMMIHIYIDTYLNLHIFIYANLLFMLIWKIVRQWWKQFKKKL